MKRVFIINLLIISFVFPSFSQIIDEPICKFAESILPLNKTTSKSRLVNIGVKLLTHEEMLALGYSENDLSTILVGFGSEKIICKVKFYEGKNIIKSVLIGGVRYLNAKSMINEYTNNGYILDELKSTGNSLFFVKKLKNKTYVSLVDFMINPQMCIANSEFRVINN